jgi:hypothetical protein
MADNKFADVLSLTPEDASLLLSSQSHIGSKNVNVQMEPYIYKKRSDGQWRLTKALCQVEDRKGGICRNKGTTTREDSGSAKGTVTEDAGR